MQMASMRIQRQSPDFGWSEMNLAQIEDEQRDGESNSKECKVVYAQTEGYKADRP